MTLKNNKILIFKSDKVGDLIHFSPCINIIKENIQNPHITLVCSNYNYQVAKNYKSIDKFIILDNNKFFKTLLNNFKTFFLTKYLYLFQFDGKSNSYRISYFVNASIKSTICFVKIKKILGKNFKITRPSIFFLKIFFKKYLFRDENNNKDTKKLTGSYQKLYFDILEDLDFKIKSKQNIFTLDKSYEKEFDNIYENKIKKKYFLFHIDERWDTFNKEIYEKISILIDKICKKNMLIITTGVKDFVYLNLLEKKYKTFNYNNNNFLNIESDLNLDAIILKNMPLNLLAYFIKNSEKNFSAHSGPIVHIGAAFGVDTIDIIKKNKNDELNRWIPIISNYTKINFEDIKDDYIDNFNI